MQVLPLLAVEECFHRWVICGDTRHHDLWAFTIDSKPRFRWLQAQTRDAGGKFADDKFKILLIAPLLDVPTHNNLDLHDYSLEVLPLLTAFQHDNLGLLRQTAFRYLKQRLLLDAAHAHFL